MATGKDARAIKRMSLLVEVASVSLYLTGGGEKMPTPPTAVRLVTVASIILASATAPT